MYIYSEDFRNILIIILLQIDKSWFIYLNFLGYHVKVGFNTPHIFFFFFVHVKNKIRISD